MPYKTWYKSLSLRHLSVREPLSINKLLTLNDLISRIKYNWILLNTTRYDANALTVPLPTLTGF
jgi:hypothetical protein